jgi:hypothetical protein
MVTIATGSTTVGEIIDSAEAFILGGLYREKNPTMKGVTQKELATNHAARRAIVAFAEHLREMYCGDADTLLRNVAVPSSPPKPLKGHATRQGDEFTDGELYQCSGCGRWFQPGDTFVTGNAGEYCYDDDTGNGCVMKFLSPAQRADNGFDR